MNYKSYYKTAVVMYLTYFVHGIGASILGQYKQNFAQMWGAEKLTDGTFDVSSVLVVIAALGLGRLISLPFAGTLSDKFGRRISALIGVASYAVYFIGIVYSPNMYVAYAFALFGGIANSFLDTGVIPACLEILVESSGLATMMTKLGVSLGQFVLPFMMGFVAANNMSFKTIFYLMAVLIILLGILIAIMPLPSINANVKQSDGQTVKKEKMKFSPVSIALIAIGFTCTSTFQLWLNCNQEFAKLCGMEDPSKIQSVYSIGTITAILVTSVLVKKFVKPVRIVVIYPAISVIMLVLVYIIRTPMICTIGGFVIGYAAAGGVLQLVTATANDLFPTNKGKITSIIMISSSLANYIILNIAGAITKSGGTEGPKFVILFNAAITLVGVLLALFVNMKYKEA